MIRSFLSTIGFDKKDADDSTPIIDEFVNQGIDFVEMRKFLDKYGHVLLKGVAYEAFELHRSKKFPEILSTTEALNQGQQCLSSFLKRFYSELKVYQAKKHDPVKGDDVWIREVEAMAVKE